MANMWTDAGNSELMDSSSQALAVRYVQKPQDGHADTVAKLSFSPSFVTYNPVTIQNIQEFFKTGEVSPICRNLFPHTGEIRNAFWGLNCYACRDPKI